ncbi:hypothetical protein JHW43_008309 [Diplocarpon mali]|nr:hypothetical protein JHW43_008309 [Diplocarpon mali]
MRFDSNHGDKAIENPDLVCFHPNDLLQPNSSEAAAQVCFCLMLSVHLNTTTAEPMKVLTTASITAAFSGPGHVSRDNGDLQLNASEVVAGLSFRSLTVAQRTLKLSAMSISHGQKMG